MMENEYKLAIYEIRLAMFERQTNWLTAESVRLMAKRHKRNAKLDRQARELAQRIAHFRREFIRFLENQTK